MRSASSSTVIITNVLVVDLDVDIIVNFGRREGLSSQICILCSKVMNNF